MLLIIGGAARTGKGILSRRLLCETHQPYLSLDVLKMGLVNGLPSFGLDPEASAIVIAGQLWPLVRAMAVNMVETDVPYIIEGEILPEHADELARRLPTKVQACFLGYADIAPKQKLAEIREFGGHPNDWISDYSDEDVLELIEQNIGFSRYLREECRRLGLLYFDTSENFEAVIDHAIVYFKDRSIQQNMVVSQFRLSVFLDCSPGETIVNSSRASHPSSRTKACSSQSGPSAGAERC